MAAALRLNAASDTELSLNFFGKPFTILQDPSSNDHGLALWDASICLLRYLEHTPRAAARLKGQPVLELGAGTGLLGIVLAHCLGCAVVLTDLPAVCANLAANVAAHPLPPGAPGALAVAPYAWSDVADPGVLALAPPGGFAWVLGTDVAYSEALNPVLLRSAAAFARAGGGGGSARCGALFCNELRCALAQDVFDTAARPLFRVKRVPTARLHPEWRAHGMLLLELSVKGGGAEGGEGGEGGEGEDAPE